MRQFYDAAVYSELSYTDDKVVWLFAVALVGRMVCINLCLCMSVCVANIHLIDADRVSLVCCFADVRAALHVYVLLW